MYALKLKGMIKNCDKCAIVLKPAAIKLKYGFVYLREFILDDVLTAITDVFAKITVNQIIAIYEMRVYTHINNDFWTNSTLVLTDKIINFPALEAALGAKVIRGYMYYMNRRGNSYIFQSRNNDIICNPVIINNLITSWCPKIIYRSTLTYYCDWDELMDL